MKTPLDHEYFRLFADCKLTQGQTRAALVDYGRAKLYLVSNGVAELVLAFQTQPYGEAMGPYDADDRAAIEKVLGFLLEQELGFFTAEPAAFPPIPDTYAYPALVSNAMIDIDQNWHDMDLLLPQLVDLGCHDIQVRIFSSCDRDKIEALVAQVAAYPIKSVELVIKHHRSLTKRYLRDLTERQFIVKNIFVHSAPRDEAYVIYPGRARNNMGNIVFLRQAITGASHCGYISPRYFVYDNLAFFQESQQHNTCLNRKVGIDVEGQIKNCPALPVAFGHIADTPLREAVVKPAFQARWHIHKDQIDTCNACEFRHVCQDCRAFTQDGKLLGKPLRCGYDPYTGTWTSDKQRELLVKKL